MFSIFCIIIVHNFAIPARNAEQHTQTGKRLYNKILISVANEFSRHSFELAGNDTNGFTYFGFHFFFRNITRAFIFRITKGGF